MYIVKDGAYLLVDITTTSSQHRVSAENFCVLLDGLGKPQNPAKAVNNLKVAAQAGEDFAFFGVECLCAVCEQCGRLFACPGHMLAIFHLGELNAKEGGGQRNCQQAVEV